MRLCGSSNASGMRMMGLTASAAARGAVAVPGPHELVEVLPLARRRTVGMTAAEVLQMRLVIRHAHHPAEGPEELPHLNPHRPSPRRAIPSRPAAADW